MRLAREGGHAFVSASLRPYLIAALADRDEASRARPTLVVVGDDRAARDLAGDLRAWLAPRRVRYYPSRGVAYESHLAPPPHLVGLRVAALDALLGAGGRAGARTSRRSWSSAQRRCRRRCPTRRCARARSRCASASCSTSTSAPPSSSRRATSASTRSRSAASSRCAAACSTCSRRPRSGRCASTCSTSRSSRCAGSRPSRSARSATPRRSRSRRRRSSPPSTASSPSSRRDGAPRGRRGRPRGASRTSPSCCRSSASARCSSCSRGRSPAAELLVAAEEELAPALRDHWDDVCAAFGDEDAHHLYVSPEEIAAALRRARAHLALGASPPTRRSSCARSRPTRPRARWPKPSRSSRSSCARATAPSWPSRAAARASARPTTSAG